MASCRFGENSDVYLFYDGTAYECCACSLEGGSSWFDSPEAAYQHLLTHVSEDHMVPRNAFNRLACEIVLNRVASGKFSLGELMGATTSARLERERKGSIMKLLKVG